MGKAICMLDPSYVKNRAPEDLHLGGLKVRKRYVTPYPPSEPPPYSTDRGGKVKIILNVREQFVNCLWGVFVGM